MTKEELLHRLDDIEWDDFEVKEAKRELPKSIWETVSAFSNTAGGWIILGVKQNGKTFEITGVENGEKLEQDLLGTLRSHNKFNHIIEVTPYKYHFDNKLVLAFYIPSSEHKPIFFNALSNTFIRSASGDQRASEYEINAMLREQSFGKMSEKSAKGTSVNDLNMDSFRSYRRHLEAFNPALTYNKLDDDIFFEKLRITKEGQLTYAGLLMFGNETGIIKHFSDFRIDYFEIPGTSYSDARARYTFRLPEMENIWEYYLALFQRLRIYADSVFKMGEMGFAKDETPQLDALREALVNMLMHADYFSPMKSRIRVFDDRIEFENPGGFPHKVEKLIREDISLPRNPVIAKLFRCAKLCENAGFGLDKILLWKQDTNNKVHFDDEFFDRAKVILERSEMSSQKGSQKSSQKSSQKILEIFRNKPETTIAEVADQIGLSARAVRKQIEKLKTANRLRRIGPDKGGHWEVVDKQ